MNIKITYNFLLDYLETDATAYDLQKYLSLCGPSIETVYPVYKADNQVEDYVLDIEITSNRVDMASVFGVAQEAVAILPRFGKKAKLKINPKHKYVFSNLNAEPLPNHKLNIEIKDQSLCERFTALGFKIPNIKQAPEFIKRRLELCDISSINNIVDISNYIMLALGQPTHMFDLDKITKNTLILRKSVKGEKITTLDGKEFELPGEDIVIEDGSGKIIDMCGIMGGENSAISTDTTKVLFFVQTYNKKNIRQTSMRTGQRSVAATYFEKGLDPENVETAFTYGVELLQKYADATACTELIDIYKHRAKTTEITIEKAQIDKIMGISVETETVKEILIALGFDVKIKKHKDNSELFHVTVPTSRVKDVAIKEDIIEEIARIYGYHNLPNNLPFLVFLKQEKELELIFKTVSRIKRFLKHVGLNEFLSYSMVSKDLLLSLDINLANNLKLANSISTEIEYMRHSLLPSLIFNLENNEGKKDSLNIFEIAKVYIPQKNDLPQEISKLAIGGNNTFFDLKGVIESLFTELAIPSYEFIACTDSTLFSKNQQAKILIDKEEVGTIGKLAQKYKNIRGIKKDLYLCEIDVMKLSQKANIILPFATISSYAIIKRDVTLNLNNTNYAEFEKLAFLRSNLLDKIELIGTYKDAVSVRFYFTSFTKNISEEEVSVELNKILTNI